MGTGFASLPDPPYYAAIFSSQRSDGDLGYGATMEQIAELVRAQPGFLGFESARSDDGFGITVAYFDSDESIRAWKAHPDHAAAQARGKTEWYEHYEIRVAKVERSYGGP